jgi:CxxC motif-containing protein (DUF1111 family)
MIFNIINANERRALGMLSAVFACSALSLACGSSSPASNDPNEGAPDGALPASKFDPFDVPVSGVTSVQFATFSDGDNLFGLPLREADGLGPLYTRNSCGSCHREGTRGPGFVQKMSVVDVDGLTPLLDQSKLKFGNTVHPLLTAGAKTPILPPGDDPSIKVSERMGPPVLGRGYMEAILDSEIERLQAEQAKRKDAIHGRVNHVTYASERNTDTTFHDHSQGEELIGRFGLKARIATLDDFTADAMQGDMGITSPLRPDEFANPDGLLDDLKPGTDVTADSVNLRANYMRLIAIPRRPEPTEAASSLFAQAKCNVCHAPALHTSPDYPLAMLADIDAPVFTDLLLHDMGLTLSDGVRDIDGEAGPRDWRTAPLLGLRFNRSYLHDGRAATVRDAILAHGDPSSEAYESAQLFLALTGEQQQTLLEFVEAL